MSTIESDPVDISEKNLSGANPFDAGEASSDRVEEPEPGSGSVVARSVESDPALKRDQTDWWARFIAWLPKRNSRRGTRQIDHVTIKRNDLWASDWDVRVEDSNCLELGLKPRPTSQPAKAARRWWWRRRR